MTRLLFVCLGNICRSPMAEFVMKDLVEKRGLAKEFQIDSAGTSPEELGNPVHPGTRRVLAAHGIRCERHTAQQIDPSDYGAYDLILGMEQRHVDSMRRLFRGDPEGKLKRLLEYSPAEEAEGPRDLDIADPWYTGDFEKTWREIDRGCRGLLARLRG